MEKIVIFFKLLYIIFTITCIDLYSKYLISYYTKVYEHHKIFFSINLLYVKNYGMAFNILDTFFIKHQDLFLILQLIFIAFYAMQLMQYNNIGYKLILGGGISNTIEQIYHGYNIDFIDIRLNNYHIGIFNFADIIILLGIIIIFNFKINIKPKNNYQGKNLIY